MIINASNLNQLKELTSSLSHLSQQRVLWFARALQNGNPDVEALTKSFKAKQIDNEEYLDQIEKLMESDIPAAEGFES